MNLTYIIHRQDTEQFLHSLNNKGIPLWTDLEKYAMYLTENEADNIKQNLNYAPYKNGNLEILHFVIK